jgi:beta-galactosidase
VRQTSLFNGGWKFHRGDVPGAHAPACDDGGWRPVGLPHDWSIEGPFDQKWASATGYLPGGVGWYRKTFTALESFGVQQVSLHFDGVYCSGEVWINGCFLGKRPSGFASFHHDLTPYLLLGDRNVIAVRVDHSQYGDARWYTGSGIYRNVRLLVTDPVHIKHWGISVTTPVVAANLAQVQAEVTVQNHTNQMAQVEIRLSLSDLHGTVVAEGWASAAVPPGGECAAGDVLSVPSPRLWSPEQPALYILRTEVHHNGEAVDAEDTIVGIRSIRFDPDEGFFLNDRNLKLKGVCLHDDAGALGVAVPPKVWERRLQTLKEAGVNAIRMSHNPHLPELYDLCDQLGFLVQDEAFDEWELGKNKWLEGWNVGMPGKDGPHTHFEEWGEADLGNMILRDRNHPSVIMWSIGNEVDYPNDPYTHEVLDRGASPQSYGPGFKPGNPHADRLGVVARRLAAIVRSLDPTRPVTAGLASALMSNEIGFADALDVAGYNYQEGRYEGDHARYAGRVLYGSENGMRWDFWEAVAQNPYVCGQFLWTGIDYLGEAGRWPARSNGAGLLDLAGNPKPEYYYRQSLWTETPMVYLGTRTVPEGEEAASLWSHKQAAPVWRGADSGSVRAVCFTNCAAAELFLNGCSLGVKSRADAPDRVLWWDVPYAPGTLTVNGLNGGSAICTSALKTAGPPQKLLARVDSATLAADGVDLAHITVTIADADGVPVYDADHEITWAIDGPARLLGLESGDHTSHEDYRAPQRKAFHGALLGYVQATETPGPVTVRLTAPGLDEAVVALRVETAMDPAL